MAAAVLALLAFAISIGAGVDDVPDNNGKVDTWSTVSTIAFLAALALLGSGVLTLRRARQERPRAARQGPADALEPRSKGISPDVDISVISYLVGIVVGLTMMVQFGGAGGSNEAIGGIVFGFTALALVAWVVGGGAALVRGFPLWYALAPFVFCYAMAIGIAVLFGDQQGEEANLRRRSRGAAAGARKAVESTETISEAGIGPARRSMHEQPIHILVVSERRDAFDRRGGRIVRGASSGSRAGSSKRRCLNQADLVSVRGPSARWRRLFPSPLGQLHRRRQVRHGPPGGGSLHLPGRPEPRELGLPHRGPRA